MQQLWNAIYWDLYSNFHHFCRPNSSDMTTHIILMKFDRWKLMTSNDEKYWARTETDQRRRSKMVEEDGRIRWKKTEPGWKHFSKRVRKKIITLTMQTHFRRFAALRTTLCSIKLWMTLPMYFSGFSPECARTTIIFVPEVTISLCHSRMTQISAAEYFLRTCINTVILVFFNF